MATHTTRLLAFATGGALLATTGLWPSATGAHAARATKCTAAIDAIVFSPGLAATKKSQNTYRSPGKGTIECDGPVLGRKPTGPGVWAGNVGSFVGSCTAGGKGTFVNTFTFPTASGTVTLVNRGPFTFGVLKGGAVGGEARGNEADGSFSVIPTKGNCVTAPATEVRVGSFEMTLKL